MQGATDRCQILSKNFAPSKALDAQAYMWHATAFDSRDIHAQHQSFFLSPQFIIMLHLGHSKTEHVLPAAFRGGCRGSHKAALHLLSNIPVSFPRMSLCVSPKRRWPQRPTGSWCSQSCMVWKWRKGNSYEVWWTCNLFAALE